MKNTILKSGKWATDTGSIFDLKINNDIVSGTFQTMHGQPDPEEIFPVTGYINGPLIGMVVSWKKYKSITSWTGVLGEDDGKDCIHATWHLARQFADKKHTQENEYWESFLTFTGTYYYQGE